MKSFRYGRCWSLFMLASGLAFSINADAAAKKKSEKLHKEIDLRAELTGRNLNQLDDSQLYVEILTRYQSQERGPMKQALSVLLSKYRNSPHTDNALYLVGYSALEKREFAEALRSFELLLKYYPNSNKAVAAEFAKGVAYKHMKFPQLAQKAFIKVRKKYPGSPESFRAESELKLLVKR